MQRKAVLSLVHTRCGTLCTYTLLPAHLNCANGLIINRQCIAKDGRRILDGVSSCQQRMCRWCWLQEAAARQEGVIVGRGGSWLGKQQVHRKCGSNKQPITVQQMIHCVLQRACTYVLSFHARTSTGATVSGSAVVAAASMSVAHL